MEGLVLIDTESMQIRRRRLHIFGEPNTGKTRSLLTFPAPRLIISAPGEKGHDTLDGAKDTFAYRWQPSEKMDSHKILHLLIEQSLASMAKHKPNTFAFEGLHKLIDHVMNSVTDGAWLEGGEIEPKLYAYGYRRFTAILDQLSSTGVPVVAFTSWAAREAERPKRPGEKASDIPTYIRPDLPGRLAKQIEGEFAVTVYQHLGKISPNQETQGLWQTRPGGEVKGCALKGRKEIVDKIPPIIPASYARLEEEWVRAEGKEAQG